MPHRSNRVNGVSAKTEATDVWALASILYERICEGRCPYHRYMSNLALRPILHPPGLQQALLLQQELVDQRIQLQKTQAWKQICSNLEVLLALQNKMLQRLRDEVSEAGDDVVDLIQAEYERLRTTRDATEMEIRSIMFASKGREASAHGTEIHRSLFEQIQENQYLSFETMPPSYSTIFHQISDQRVTEPNQPIPSLANGTPTPRRPLGWLVWLRRILHIGNRKGRGKAADGGNDKDAGPSGGH